MDIGASIRITDQRERISIKKRMARRGIAIPSRIAFDLDELIAYENSQPSTARRDQRHAKS